MSNLIRIRFEGKEAQEKGFYTLVSSGTSAFSDKRNEFVVPDKAIDILHGKKIKFELISQEK